MFVLLGLYQISLQTDPNRLPIHWHSALIKTKFSHLLFYCFVNNKLIHNRKRADTTYPATHPVTPVTLRHRDEKSHVLLLHRHPYPTQQCEHYCPYFSAVIVKHLYDSTITYSSVLCLSILAGMPSVFMQTIKMRGLRIHEWKQRRCYRVQVDFC